MLKSILRCICVLFFFTQCSHQEHNVGQYPVDTLRINGSDSLIYADQVFSDIEFIPLETTAASMFGFIDDIIIMEDKYIILDRTDSKVMIYDKEGKYVSSFENPENNFRFIQIVLDNNTNQIVCRDGNSYDLIYYDENGSIIKKIDTQGIDYYTWFQPNEDSVLFYMHYPLEKEKVLNDSIYTYLQLRDVDSFSLRKTVLPFPMNAVVRGEIPNIPKNFYDFGEEGIKLVVPGVLKYYTLDKKFDVLSLTVLQLNENKYSQTPSNFLTNKKLLNKRMAYLDKNTDMIHSIHSIYSSKDGITFFTLAKNGGNANIIYKPDHTSIVIEDDVIYDINKSALPPIGLYVIGSDSEYFYSFYSAKPFLSFITDLPNKYTVFKEYPELERIYNETTVVSNPVLVKFKIKS